MARHMNGEGARRDNVGPRSATGDSVRPSGRSRYAMDDEEEEGIRAGSGHGRAVKVQGVSRFGHIVGDEDDDDEDDEDAGEGQRSGIFGWFLGGGGRKRRRGA